MKPLNQIYKNKLLLVKLVIYKLKKIQIIKKKANTKTKLSKIKKILKLL